jgi:HK97 family phage major capsid protein
MMKELLAGAGNVVEKHEENAETKEVRASQEYVNAYAEYIKTGDDRECRALLTETVSGTVPVPVLLDEIVRTAWDNEEILSRVRKTYIRGNLKVAFEKSATGAAVHTEGTTAPTEESLELGIVTMIPRNIKKWITISDEAATMGGEAFLRYVYDELTYQIVKYLSGLVVSDIAALNTSAGSTAPSAAKITQAPGLNTVATAFANLSDEARNPVIIMNKLTYADFKAAQAAGNFNVDPFMDLPVLFNNTLPAYSSASASAVYAIVGDLSGAQINYPEGEGVVIKYDELSLAEKDLVKIVGRQYAAHAVTACGRFCNVAKPSGT